MPDVLAGVAQRAQVRYRTGVLDPVAGYQSRRDWKRNLILDTGLDSVGARSWGESITWGVIGTGTNPTARDSGVVTAARAADVVTASAGFFEAGDVGRLIRWDSGEEDYIAVYTSPTVVETIDGGTVASGLFSVYYVDDTGLQTESKRSDTTTGLGPNGIAWNSGLGAWVLERTFIFSAEVGAVTYNEVGWAWTNVSALFGRDIVTGGDALAAGQQYVVTVELSISPTPLASTAVGNVGTGLDTSGAAVIECVATAGVFTANAPVISPPGAWGLDMQLEPSGQSHCIAASAAWTQSVAVDGNTTSPAGFKKAMALAAYNTGEFSRTRSVTFSVAEANGAIHGLAIAQAQDVQRIGFSVKFTAPQTKLATQTLTVVFRLSWQRKF